MMFTNTQLSVVGILVLSPMSELLLQKGIFYSVLSMVDE